MLTSRFYTENKLENRHNWGFLPKYPMHTCSRYLAITNVWGFNYLWWHWKSLTWSNLKFCCGMYLNHGHSDRGKWVMQPGKKHSPSPRVHISRRFCSNCVAVTLKKGLNVVLIFENCPPPKKSQLIVLMIKIKSKERSKKELVLYWKAGICGEFFWCWNYFCEILGFPKVFRLYLGTSKFYCTQSIS